MLEETTNTMDWGPHSRTPVPFSGLGFDLGPVYARAALLTFRPIRTRRRTSVPRFEPRASGGYALLLTLGMEIRAR